MFDRTYRYLKRDSPSGCVCRWRAKKGGTVEVTDSRPFMGRESLFMKSED